MKIKRHPLRIFSTAFGSALLLAMGPRAAVTSAPPPTVANAAASSNANVGARSPSLPAPTPADVEKLLVDRINAKGGVGVVVALISPSGTVNYVSAGNSGQPNRPRLDADTIFEIGSITKPFTATLLAQMVERGEVTLQTPLSSLAPEGQPLASNAVGAITLEALATHTSGLPRLPLSWPFMKSMLQRPDNPYLHYSSGEMWAYLAKRTQDKSTTPTVEYSNLGYGILGDVLARKLGTGYEAVIQQRITGPLKMGDTSTVIAPSQAERHAIGHDEALRPTAYWDLPAMPGAGALRSTARDMAAFIIAQRDGTLAGAREAQRTRFKVDDNNRVGLGWMVNSRHGDDIVWHNGGTGGFRSFAGFSRTTGKGVVVLANSAIGADDVGMHLLNPAFAIKPIEPPKRSWFGVAITALVLLVSLIGLLRARPTASRDGASPLASDASPSSTSSTSSTPTATPTTWRSRFDRAPEVFSRSDALWRLADVGVVVALLGLFAPWRSMPSIMVVGALSILCLAAVHFLWKMRTLPWIAIAPLRKTTIVSRAFTALLMLGCIMLLG